MPAANLYAQSFSSLNNTLNSMLSEDWISALDSQSIPTRLQAARTLAQVQSAVNVLSNAALADIADKMNAQQGALETATNNLNQAIGNLQNVQDILNAAATLLNVVLQIVPLI